MFPIASSVLRILIFHGLRPRKQTRLPGTIAAQLQLQLLPLIDALFSQVNPIPAKAAVAAMGFGEEHLRMPLTPMEEPQRSNLLEQLRKLGVLA